MEIVLVLMILAIGISAYGQAKRQGIWSWKQFFKTIAGLWFLCCIVGFLLVFLMKRWGSDYAGTITIIAVLLIAVGVTLLAIFLKPRKG